MSGPADPVRPLDLAQRVVDKAQAAGASFASFQCDAVAVASRDSSVTVRLQEIESVQEAASRAVGLRVIVDRRQAVVSSADISDEALDQIVGDALELAAIAEPDEHAGLPNPADQTTPRDDLQLYDEAIDAIAGQERIDRALACEQAAMDSDKRIDNSGGSSFSTRVAEVALADSNGFSGSYLGTSASLGVEVMATDTTGQLRNDYSFTVERQLHRLQDGANRRPRGRRPGPAPARREEGRDHRGPRRLGAAHRRRLPGRRRRRRRRRSAVSPQHLPGRP